MNSGKPTYKGDKVTYTYLDSYIKPVTETRQQLDAEGVLELVDKRRAAFGEAPAGAREGDELRSDRKYVAAQKQAVLKQAWVKADSDQKFELAMMLDHTSHHGLSDPKEVHEYADEQDEIPMAGDVGLGMGDW